MIYCSYSKTFSEAELVKSQKIRLYYGIFLTVLTVAVGVAFIIAVAGVYYGGIAQGSDAPFADISKLRGAILVPCILLLVFIAAIIGGAVLSVLFPVAQKNTYKDNGKNLERLKNRIPTAGGEDYTNAKRDIAKYEKARRIVWNAALAVFAASAITILIYAFNASHYHTGAFKADILKLARTVLISTAIGLLVGIGAVITDEILIKRETAAAKAAFVAGDKDARPAPKEITKKAGLAGTVAASVIAGLALLVYGLAPLLSKSVFSLSQTGVYILTFGLVALIAAGISVYAVVKRYIPEKVNGILLLASRIAVGVLAVTFIFLGIFNGGANDVLLKAINICTECIGLG